MRCKSRRAFLKSGLVAGAGVTYWGPRAWGAVEQGKSAPVWDGPVIDAHVHFWDPGRLEYGWLRNSPLGGPKLPADYWKAAAGFRVEQVVFVQADCRRDQAPAEVAWVEQLAKQEPRIAAVVAFAAMDDEKALTAALEEFSDRALVRGVRHLVQGERDTKFCLRPEFVAGVKRVGEAKLVFEVGARDDQLPAVAQLVEGCPVVTFVLDHLGNPRIREGVFEPWAQSIRRLAALPNISCKVSGAVTRADWKSWKPEQLKPYVEQVLNSFGFQRVLFGSDWPVCTLACSLRRWLEVLDGITHGCTRADRERLWAGNARRLFRT